MDQLQCCQGQLELQHPYLLQAHTPLQHAVKTMQCKAELILGSIPRSTSLINNLLSEAQNVTAQHVALSGHYNRGCTQDQQLT